MNMMDGTPTFGNYQSMDFDLIQKKLIWVGQTKSGGPFKKDWALFEVREMKSIETNLMHGRVPMTGSADEEDHMTRTREQSVVAESGLQPTTSRELILPTTLMIL